jgi:hypothetical protein
MTTCQEIAEQALKRIANPDWEWHEAAISKIAMSIAPSYIPHPETEAYRLSWDKETQSVKQEIISFADMYENPSNNLSQEKSK